MGAPVKTCSLDRFGLILVAVLITAVGIIGFGLSAVTVSAAVRPTMPAGWYGAAPAVPISIDLGILAFAGLDLLLCRRARRVWWIPLAHDGLCFVTVGLNIAGQHSLVGEMAHGATVCLWFLGVKAAAATTRTWDAPSDARHIPVACWVLAPIRTPKLWRRETLARIRPELAGRPDAADGPPTDGQSGLRSSRRRAAERPPKSARTLRPKLAIVAPEGGSDKRTAVAEDARRIGSELVGQGRSVTRATVADALRAAGLSVSSGGLSDLVAAAKEQMAHQAGGGQ